MDERERRTDEELVAELRNKLVIDIVEAHKGKQEAPAEIEPVEILSDQPNHANHGTATEKIVKVLHMKKMMDLRKTQTKYYAPCKKCIWKRETKVVSAISKNKILCEDVSLAKRR